MSELRKLVRGGNEEKVKEGVDHHRNLRTPLDGDLKELSGRWKILSPDRRRRITEALC